MTPKRAEHLTRRGNFNQSMSMTFLSFSIYSTHATYMFQRNKTNTVDNTADQKAAGVSEGVNYYDQKYDESDEEVEVDPDDVKESKNSWANSPVSLFT